MTYPLGVKAAKRFWHRSLRQQVIQTLGWVAGLSSFVVFAEWYAVSPIGYGGLFFLYISVFLFFPWCLAWAAVPLSVFFLPWHRTRKHALTVVACGLIVLPAGLLAIYVSAPFRSAAFHRLAGRSEPLVRAIRQYIEQTGYPPADLDDLVPEYLPAVPRTGMPAYPDYEYSSGHDPERWDGNPWVLYVHTSSGGINFDQFLYFPLQNYPERGYGGTLQRIGDWAYVHE